MESMAAGSRSLRATPCVMDDSMIFSLLDQSWYLQSILNHSMTSVSVPSSIESSAISTSEVESDTTLRSSEAGSTNESVSSTGSGKRWNSTIDKSELQRVFNRFDENADGLISVEELRRWCTKCSGKDVSDTEADCMISCVDRNNDGAVDFNEFLSFYQIHHSGLEEAEDNNTRARNNEETENEEEDLLLEAFRVFDRDNDGFISAEELQAVLVNLGIPEGKRLINCKKMIRNVDRNGDGKCDLREFQEMMSAQSWNYHY